MMADARQLKATDIPASLELSTLAGWNQTAADWLAVLQLDPEGCQGIDCDGRLVATTTMICYGDTLAWIGMVLTHPEYRRRGFARTLVQNAIQLAERRNIATVKLDATDAGRPLYESLGFRTEQQIQRWSGASIIARPTMPSPGIVSLAAIANLDREAFGADRQQALRLLASHCKPAGAQDGYIISRPGTRASFVGPFVARTLPAARSLLLPVLQAPEQRWYWDLLPSNQNAVALATDSGFRLDRTLTRMVLGERMRSDDTLVYGAAGFEFG